MNKKILFLVLFQIWIFAKVSIAQQPWYPCDTPPTNTCIQDQFINNGDATWHTSHGGSVLFSNNNAPTPQPPGSQSLYMSSVLSQGSGAFTCYPFEQGETYKVCYWVRNNSGCPTNPHGRLYVFAARNLRDMEGVGNAGVPNASQQLIDNGYYGPHPGGAGSYSQNCVHDWEFRSVTFTAHGDYNNLWLYPLNPVGPPPPGVAQWGLDYIVEVDDIRVEKITGTTPLNFTVTSTKDPIDGCNDQTTLTIQNMPAGYEAIWTPAVSTTNPTGSVVTASPCESTTYKIEIYDANAYCGSCTREVIYYRVEVNQWSDPANIISPQTVGCTGDIELDYNDPGTCTGVTYTWIDPQGNPYPGKTHTVANGNPITANALHTGEWTLQVDAGNDCPEEHKFFIAVGSCCVSTPSFTVDPSSCNPIRFINTSTGITNHVGTLWSFGDGTTSDQMNPIHTYQNVNVTPPQTTASRLVCLTMIYEDDQGESCCERYCDVVQVCSTECAVNADFETLYIGGPNHTFYFHDLSSGSGGTTSYNFCEYTWNFGDGSPIHTHGPYSTMQHIFAGPGPWYVCVTVKNCTTDANGDPIECQDTKCMWIYPPGTMPTMGEGDQAQEKMPKPGETLVNKPNNDKPLTVYPNPNKGSFSISFNGKKGNYDVLVRDIQGREIYTNKHIFDGSSPIKIYLNDVANGIYSVEVRNDKEKYIKQITISR